MDQGRYRGVATRGGLWGLLAALIVGVPLFSFLLVGATLGNCGYDSCEKPFWGPVALPVLAVTIPIYLAVRWIVNRIGARG